MMSASANIENFLNTKRTRISRFFQPCFCREFQCYSNSLLIVLVNVTGQSYSFCNLVKFLLPSTLIREISHIDFFKKIFHFFFYLPITADITQIMKSPDRKVTSIFNAVLESRICFLQTLLVLPKN